MSVPNEIIGIHQSDVIIRSAIMAAIDDLRANPWLVDHAFQALAKDSLTKEDYGQKEIDNARAWFQKTPIAVHMSHSLVDAKLPCISITLAESSEAETTLSDTHYVPAEDDDRIWPALTPEFSASFGPTTGVLVVPQEIGDGIVLAPGMLVIDKANNSHEILEVIDAYTVQIGPANADFSKSVIKGKPPAQIASIESVRMKESYYIGCHVAGESQFLMYLHTLLVFILYRYKARLLEARGFERSVVSSSDFRLNPEIGEGVEVCYSRHLTLTGYVTQVWPGDINPKITSTTVAPLKVIGSGNLPGDTDPDDASWVGDQDMLTAKF